MPDQRFEEPALGSLPGGVLWELRTMRRIATRTRRPAAARSWPTHAPGWGCGHQSS